MPLAEKIKQFRPPALTTGLAIFCLILHYAHVYDSLKWQAGSFNLNRLNFYPLVFPTTTNFLLEYLLLIPFLAQYELENGTVRAGVVLNIGALLPGLFANLLLLCKTKALDLFRADFSGVAGYLIIFSTFLSITSWSKSFVFKGISLAYIIPIVLFIGAGCIVPHGLIIAFFSIVLGAGLGTQVLGFLVNGTSKPVAWIEKKLSPLINKLGLIVKFVKETDIRNDFQAVSDGADVDLDVV